MKTFWMAVVLVGVVQGITPASAADAGKVADTESTKIIDCMRANIPQSLRVLQFELNSVDRTGGNRMMRGKLFAKRDNGKLRAMIKIKSPPDLSGAAYMVREKADGDEMYVFLPALNKVRRINGAGSDGPLFGTDFSYTDIKQMQNAVESGTMTIEKPEMIEGRAVYVLSIIPKVGAPSRYSLIRNWVDQKACVPLKIEFSEGTMIRKRLIAPVSAITQSGAIWYLSEAQINDLKDNTHTTLKITGLASDVNISERYFGPATFANAD